MVVIIVIAAGIGAILGAMLCFALHQEYWYFAVTIGVGLIVGVVIDIVHLVVVHTCLRRRR